MANKKDIHIVFGRSSTESLLASNEVDLKSIQLITLHEDLTTGPICGGNYIKEIEKREDWYSKIFEFDFGWYIANEDVKKIKKLIKNYKNEQIYIWTGLRIYEILHTARLLYHLSVPCNNIFLIDFSKIPPNDIDFSKIPPKNVDFSVSPPKIYYKEEIIKPKTLNEVDPSKIKGYLAKYFYQLTEEKLSYFVQQWEKLKAGNSILRILDENEQVLEVEETYFDSLLMSFCTDKEYKKAWLIIGRVSGMNESIPYEYFKWRLKQLVLTKKLTKRGKLRKLRDYEVKLPSIKTKK